MKTYEKYINEGLFSRKKKKKENNTTSFQIGDPVRLKKSGRIGSVYKIKGSNIEVYWNIGTYSVEKEKDIEKF